MQTRVRVPARRAVGLAITETTDEVLIYDTERHHIHHLNATTSAVWRICDGAHAVDEIARLASLSLGQRLDETTVRLALTRLADANLLADPLPPDLRAARVSRRTFMRRAAVASAIAIPAIASTSAPAFAATPARCGQYCNEQGDCTLDANCAYCGPDNLCSAPCPSSCSSSKFCLDHNAGCPYCHAPGGCNSTLQGAVCSPTDFPCSGSYPNCINGSCSPAPSNNPFCGRKCTTNSQCDTSNGNGKCKYCNGGLCSDSQPMGFAPANSEKQTLQSSSSLVKEDTPTPTPTQEPPTPTPTPEPPTPIPTEVPPTPTPEPTDPPTPTPEPPTPTQESPQDVDQDVQATDQQEQQVDQTDMSSVQSPDQPSEDQSPSEGTPGARGGQ